MAHLSVLLPSSHPCQLPSLLLPALLLALSMATLPSHRQGKDSLLSPTSRERQKSKKRPKLAILSSDAMQSWITVLPILRESQVFPHSYYWVSFHSAFLSSWGRIGDGMSTGNGDSEELAYSYLNLMKPTALEVKVARGNSLTVNKEIGGKKEWKQVPGYLGQVALLGRTIALHRGGKLQLKMKSPTSVKWMELLMAVVT